MPKASKQSASQTVALEGYEGRFEDLGHDTTVGFEEYTEDADVAPFFAGLPDDRCQCSHWGYVIRGKVTFRFADRDETYEAGDAYYAPPGHTPVMYAGTELVEFSPTEELGRTMAVVTRNLQAAGVVV
jgi:hypothetical protein